MKRPFLIWYYITGSVGYFDDANPTENETYKKSLSDFSDENKELSSFDFFRKLQNEFPELEYYHKARMLKTMRTIKNILVFFLVLTILSVLAGIIYYVIQSGALDNNPYR